MRIFIWMSIVLLIGCSEKQKAENPMEVIVDQEVRETLARAFQKAGGLSKWQAIDTLSFDKKSILYSEDGYIESDVFQRQQFVFSPYFQASLTWEKDSIHHHQVYDGSQTIKYENNKIVAEQTGAHPAILSASYVISMPYELVKDAELMSFNGITNINNVSLKTLKVNYKSEDPLNDTWWYFFDQNDNYWGSKVYHEPTYALIENTSMDESTGIKFPSYRKSYRVDSLNNKQFLRAEFWYSNYKLR